MCPAPYWLQVVLPLEVVLLALVTRLGLERGQEFLLVEPLELVFARAELFLAQLELAAEQLAQVLVARLGLELGLPAE